MDWVLKYILGTYLREEGREGGMEKGRAATLERVLEIAVPLLKIFNIFYYW